MKFNRMLLIGVMWGVLMGMIPVQGIKAHEGGPQLYLNHYEALVGHTLTVNGANLGTDLMVQIMLVSNDATVFLGEALCDGHGDFTKTFTLPSNLAPGIYTLQAIDTSVVGVTQIMASVSLRISNASAASSFIAIHPVIWLGMGVLAALLLVTSTVVWRRHRESVPG